MGWQDAPLVNAGGNWSSAPLVDDKAAPVSDFSGNLRLGSFDTGIRLPDELNRRLAQFGSGVADLPVGLSQMFGRADSADVDSKRARDAQLNSDLVGKALNFAGKVAPWLAVPMGGGVPGAIATGAAMGASEPVGTGESRATNAAIGGAANAIIPGAVSYFRNSANGANSELARSALSQGIPIGLADATDSKLVKAARSILNDTPFIGGIGGGQKEAVQGGFNRAVGNTFGANAEKLTPDVVGAAKNQITGKLNDIWGKNAFTLDGGFVQDINNIGKRAEMLNPEQRATVEAWAQKLLSKVDQNGQVPGGFVNNWQSELRLAAEGDRGLAQSVLGDLRKAAINAFNRGVAPEDAAALAQARAQYGAFKTVSPILDKAEAGVAGRSVGDVSPALLSGAVARKYGSASRSPFGDLPQIGSQFVQDRVAQTGGSPRAFLQNMMLGGLIPGAGAAAGAAGGMVTGGAGAVAGLGVGAGAQKLLGSPQVLKSLLGSPQGRSLLAQPDLALTLQELSKNGLLRLPAASAVPMLGLLSPALE